MQILDEEHSKQIEEQGEKQEVKYKQRSHLAIAE